jgi:hypothetical protein
MGTQPHDHHACGTKASRSSGLPATTSTTSPACVGSSVVSYAVCTTAVPEVPEVSGRHPPRAVRCGHEDELARQSVPVRARPAVAAPPGRTRTVSCRSRQPSALTRHDQLRSPRHAHKRSRCGRRIHPACRQGFSIHACLRCGPRRRPLGRPYCLACPVGPFALGDAADRAPRSRPQQRKAASIITRFRRPLCSGDCAFERCVSAQTRWAVARRGRCHDDRDTERCGSEEEGWQAGDM